MGILYEEPFNVFTLIFKEIMQTLSASTLLPLHVFTLTFKEIIMQKLFFSLLVAAVFFRSAFRWGSVVFVAILCLYAFKHKFIFLTGSGMVGFQILLTGAIFCTIASVVLGLIIAKNSPLLRFNVDKFLSTHLVK